MSRIQIRLEFDQYDPPDDKPFRIKATGCWLTDSEMQAYVIERIEKAASMMDKDDQLTVSINTAPGEQEA